MTTSDAKLRRARRDRVFDAMMRAGLDVLVLSRRDSVAYATGLRSLWTAGTRPFGAAAVLSAAVSTHLLASWDAGVPPEVPFENLYGITWNPAVMAQALGAIPGLRDTRRIGVDALSPGFERAVRRLAIEADVVPADDLLWAVRAVKLPGEVEHIRAATAIAAAALEAARDAVDRGGSRGEALAAALRVAATRGATVPASAPVVAADPALVCVDVGFLVHGYEGGVGRTFPGSDAAREVQRLLLAACLPGATAGDLRQAARGATRWMVRGSGLGFEPPVITDALGEKVVIEEGMVLSVEVDVEGQHRRDLALVGDAGAVAFSYDF